MRKVKIGLIGCGDVAFRDYLPQFHRLADKAQLEAVSSRNETRARQAKEQFGAGVYYMDYRRMLREADIDGVLNLTPAQVHASITLAALDAGVHVFTEKPVACSLEEADLLIETVMKKGLRLVCAPSIMLWASQRWMKELIEQGEIGEVCYVNAHVDGRPDPWPGYTSDPTWFFQPGAGPLVDIGVYPLTVLTTILGPAKRVSGMSGLSIPRRTVIDGPARGKEIEVKVDDNSHLVLDFGESVFASLDCTYCVHAAKRPPLEFYGTEGTLVGSLFDASAPVELYRPERGGWESSRPPWETPKVGVDHIRGVEDLVDSILEDRPPLLDPWQARHVLEIILEGLRSAHEGRTIELASTFRMGGI